VKKERKLETDIETIILHPRENITFNRRFWQHKVALVGANCEKITVVVLSKEGSKAREKEHAPDPDDCDKFQIG
jgi:hypothetical protein